MHSTGRSSPGQLEADSQRFCSAGKITLGETDARADGSGESSVGAGSLANSTLQ